MTHFDETEVPSTLEISREARGTASSFSNREYRWSSDASQTTTLPRQSFN